MSCGGGPGDKRQSMCREVGAQRKGERMVGKKGGFVIRGSDARGAGSQERGTGERRGKEGKRGREGVQK